ncbi:ATP-binding protein [Arthrobacter sp. NPDC089319]|uniref:ATP-binding protein n=1 Tax=Arthrobacter sp. NPDC089319 TaxID=3155915 RepID=UPI00341F23BE
MAADHVDDHSLAADGFMAASVDGRSFSFQGVGRERLDLGSLVSIDVPDRLPMMGQIHQLRMGESGVMSGSGRIIGSFNSEGMVTPVPAAGFREARIAAADRSLVELLHSSSGALLEIGTFTNTDRFDARLIPKKFNRHTFWCGQSGSGKTYALGVVLEEILLRTRLPMVILDPNADFVLLGESADKAAAGSAAPLGSRSVRVLRPNVEGAEPLRARFSTMSTRSQAAVLRLDPLIDRAEYNDFLHIENFIGGAEPESIVEQLRRAQSPGSDALASRIENLRLAEWRVWARHDAAASEILAGRPDATVLDLGGFDFAEESLVVVLSVLDSLWAARDAREPLLIVIDEAHNLCSSEPGSPLQRAVRERIVQIAAEGRKFGLWLLLSTQRPSKLDPDIISQCDNLALMKMSSPSDLDGLASTFGFVPRTFLELSPFFRQGEALFAGGFVPAPGLVTVRTRLTREGGSDVRVPLREMPT